MTDKPERRPDESPVDYYKRTGCVPANFLEPHDGRYYCNPAHCHHSWDDKVQRDEHVKWAYSLLD